MPYETREQAIAVAVSLNCPIGAHQSEGGWFPCSSQEVYAAAKKMKKSQVKVPLMIGKTLSELEIEVPKEGFTFDELHDIHEQLLAKGQGSDVLTWAKDVLTEFGVAKSSEEPPNDVNHAFEICKVDESLGLVFGWAIVCKQEGQDYFDTQGDHITEQAMLGASADFMQNSRMAKDMHRPNGELPGSVLFAFPMTTEIAKAFGIETSTTGLMVAMKPDSQEILNKYTSGEYTGFSIGGSRIPGFTEEVV